MVTTAVDDIISWADSKLTAWRRDALRRLASNGQLTVADQDELLEMVKSAAGFNLQKAPVVPIPLNKTHFSSTSAGPAVVLKGIKNVKNVNRLVSRAALEFGHGLTIVYGKNGTGKSGFARILRTACRSRVEDPAKLRILADVYGSAGPQEAELVVESGGNEIPIAWKPGANVSELLLQVGVFDSNAAQLYVDQGNQIQFLPFGLALPHKLNELCLSLKDRLDKDRQGVTQQLQLAVISFEVLRSTAAQSFYAKLAATSTDAAIDAACAFSKQDEERLAELSAVLASKETTEADVRAIATWCTSAAADALTIETALKDTAISGFEQLKQKATEARAAAAADASNLFAGEPLPGVGLDTWKVMWDAAKEYSTSLAYPGQPFPVISADNSDAHCLLCHQPLSTTASERLQRFHQFVDGALAKAAAIAENTLESTRSALPDANILTAKDWQTRIEQVRKRDDKLAGELDAFRAEALLRLKRARGLLTIGSAADTSPLGNLITIAPSVTALSTKLTAEADAIKAANDVTKRTALTNEAAELADRKVLADNKATIVKRRNLQKEDQYYEQALGDVHTRGITQKANDLIDDHLTKAVIDQFETERKGLDVQHLNIGLARRSGKTKASFQTDPGVKLAKASDILSEGEQRALALSAFLTEIVVMPGSGPIVVDDPISSLDRDRGLRVAERLVEEATKRQVVVFTHDLIFFNDLCRVAEDKVDVKTVALFSNGASAGHIDPAGVAWQGLPVKKRLNLIRDEFARVRKLANSSPSQYELQTKHLYSRLRDAYERMVEELIFCDVVRRGVDRVETQKLRYVHLSDALAIRFHNGMTMANTYSHDNPASATVVIPKPADVDADFDYFQKLMDDLKDEGNKAEANRPSMKKK